MMAWLEANVLNKPGAMHQPQCCFGKPMYLTITSFPNVDKAETVRPPTPWCHGATGWDDFQGEVLAEWTIKNGNVQNAKTVEFLVSAACCDARLRNRLLCLSGHDLFPTIILCVHPFFRQQTYYILSHLRALSCSHLKYRQTTVCLH